MDTNPPITEKKCTEVDNGKKRQWRDILRQPFTLKKAFKLAYYAFQAYRLFQYLKDGLDWLKGWLLEALKTL